SLRELGRSDPRPRWIVLTAEPITDIDTSAADVLVQTYTELDAEGIALVFAEVKDPVKRKLERFGVLETIDLERFYPTIEAAVAAFPEVPEPRIDQGGPPSGTAAPEDE